jgi:putative peptidoglycan lipid II flippase
MSSSNDAPAASGAPQAPSSEPPAPRRGVAALLVAAGIFSSRVIGLVRERVIAGYFGTGVHADALAAGLRLPNILQNLLGEGTLSASFIPAYSALLGQGRTKEAGRVAGAVFALLLGIAGVIALAGVLLAPYIVTLFTPGFEGERRELTIAVVRIFFPMTGVLVLSAWALGILNSHRRFFLPYFAPVLWNVAIIAALVAYANRVDLEGLLLAGAWGALVGGFLQFGIQLPTLLRLERELGFGRAGFREPAFRQVLRNAGPAVLGRGVVQLSGYVDLLLASLLAIGAPVRLRFAQTLYMLPISLFGMSVAATELPELAREGDAAVEALRTRMAAALRRVAFFVVPSCVAFIAIGEVLVAGVFRTGEFLATDVRIVWLILAVYSLGLIPSTATRVFQSTFFALRDTRTPARVAAIRVVAAAAAGGVFMTQLEPVSAFGFVIPSAFASFTRGLPLGPVGLALGATLGAWLEWRLLKSRLAQRVGAFGAGAGALARMFVAAGAGAVAAWALQAVLPALHPLALAVAAAALYGGAYFGMARVLGLEEARLAIDGVLRRLGRH